MQSTAFRSIYDLAFQVSPIILNGGSVAGTLGGMMPILGLVSELAGTAQGVLTGGMTPEAFPFRFIPIPGSTLISNAVGTYPFANQQVAANAIIEQPRNISLLMIAPVNDTGGYLTKLPLLTALQTSLAAHIAAGGTFHIATPAYLYTDCLLTAMTDVTPGDTRQQQAQFQLDFVKPLVTQSAATSAFNALMQKLQNGTQVTSSKWSGAESAIGAAMQGAAQGVGNLYGSVNQFLSGPL